jgi:hypothetical protein
LVKRHLEQCWKCRSRQFDIEARVRALMSVVDCPDFLDAARVAEAKHKFLAWRDTCRREAGVPSRKPVPGGNGWRLRVAAVLVPAVLLCGTAGWWYSRPDVVLAAPLLARSTANEEAPARTSAQVVHRIIRLEERSGGKVRHRRIEIWHGPSAGDPARRVETRRVYDEHDRLISCGWTAQSGSRMVVRRGASPQAQPVSIAGAGGVPESIEAAGQMDLSAKQFTALLGDVSRAVVEETPSTYVVRYQASSTAANKSPRVTSAALILNRPDLRPIEQSLVVEREKLPPEEYRLVETRFDSYPRSAISASVFEPDPELLKPVTSAAVLAAPAWTASAAKPAAAPEPPHISVNVSLEVEVISLLAQANISLGDQAALKRTPEGGVVLNLTVENESQEASVLAALAPVLDDPTLKVEMALRAAPPPQGLATARLAERARRAKAHALALKQVAARFTAGQLAAMDEDTRREWRTMVRRHAQAFEYETMTLREELQAVFPGAQVRGGPRGVESIDLANLPATAERLANLGTRHEEIIRAAFSGMKVIDAPGLAQSLRTAEALAAAVRIAMADE